MKSGILAIFLSLILLSPSEATIFHRTVKKAPSKSAPVSKTVTKPTVVTPPVVEAKPADSTQPGGRVLTAQQDAELKDWIIGIQKLAEDSKTQADNAESEAAESRAEASKAQGDLQDAINNADTLQKAVDAQTVKLNEAIVAEQKAEAHDAKTTKENNLLKNILGIEAGAIALLICLWLKVPTMPLPYYLGIVITVLAPILVFLAVKLIL